MRKNIYTNTTEDDGNENNNEKSYVIDNPSSLKRTNDKV